MAIDFYKSSAPWSNDWCVSTVSSFGDPDDDERGPHGIVVSIKASSDAEAEQRVVDFMSQNYDDNFYGAKAISDGSNGDGTYNVRVVWRA